VLLGFVKRAHELGFAGLIDFGSKGRRGGGRRRCRSTVRAPSQPTDVGLPAKCAQPLAWKIVSPAIATLRRLRS